jgi:TPP-dependent pyruvate/acetoin dehydrogenase alpha subunit
MMTKEFKLEVLQRFLRVRMAQLIINEMYKKGAFKVPIHLALGHEAIAVALSTAMGPHDQLILNHRNIHYNLSKVESLKSEIDEYLLKKEGLAGGELGSMNLINEAHGIVYSSSILGNNLAVAAGFAMAKSIKNEDGVVMVVTGDGAIEEGTFYESLVFEKSNQLPVVIVVENNQWSLGTKIEERRCPIDIGKLTGALGIPFEQLTSNDTYEYFEKLTELKARAQELKTPVCIEVPLTTLGWWRQKTAEFPEGKFINYHAGPSPAVNEQEDPYLTRTNEDPLYVMEKYFGEEMIRSLASDTLAAFKKELT